MISNLELFRFRQRGRLAGYWTRVPLQGSVDDLHSRLTARGHIVREIPALPECPAMAPANKRPPSQAHSLDLAD